MPNCAEEAVARYAASLYRLAYTHLRTPADAEDAVQDVFLRYLRHAPHFESDEHERAWLIRVTINRCRDIRRAAKLRIFAELDEQTPAHEPDDDAAALLAAVLALPEKYRTAIHLHYYEGYAIAEIAAILHIPASTVGTRLARGRRLLHTALTAKGEDS